jgi:hypothetical protein
MNKKSLREVIQNINRKGGEGAYSTHYDSS